MRLRRHTSSSQAHHSCPCWVRGLVHVIATAGPVTDVPDEGSGSARARSGPLTAHELGAVTGSLRPALSAAWDRDRRSSRRSCGRSEVSVRWPSKEEPMHSEDDRRSARADRRLVGVDRCIASDHTVRVLRGDGSEVRRRRACPTVVSLTLLETAALVGAPAGTRLEVVMEPTGPAWLPVAVFFTSRGHRVFRVASAKAADLRRFLSRHAKSNGIDADTLARLPLLAPGSLQPLELPGVEAAALDRRVRACDRLSRQGALHQRRIKDLVCAS